jgi:hypothetical protein
VFAGAFDADTMRVAVSADGSRVLERTSPEARWPANLQYLVFGYSYGAGGPPLNGYVKRVSLTRAIPTDAQLQAWSGGNP